MNDVLTEADRKILTRRFLKRVMFSADDVARLRRIRRLYRLGVINEGEGDEDD